MENKLVQFLLAFRKQYSVLNRILSRDFSSVNCPAVYRFNTHFALLQLLEKQLTKVSDFVTC